MESNFLGGDVPFHQNPYLLVHKLMGLPLDKPDRVGEEDLLSEKAPETHQAEKVHLCGVILIGILPGADPAGGTRLDVAGSTEG
jgi:hypothetical protein